MDYRLTGTLNRLVEATVRRDQILQMERERFEAFLDTLSKEKREEALALREAIFAEAAQPTASGAGEGEESGQAAPLILDSGRLEQWERIPDKGHDRTMLKLWCEDKTYQQIAALVSLSFSRVKNRITELRNEHGREIVPYHRNMSG